MHDDNDIKSLFQERLAKFESPAYMSADKADKLWGAVQSKIPAGTSAGASTGAEGAAQSSSAISQTVSQFGKGLLKFNVVLTTPVKVVLFALYTAGLIGATTYITKKSIEHDSVVQNTGNVEVDVINEFSEDQNSEKIEQGTIADKNSNEDFGNNTEQIIVNDNNATQNSEVIETEHRKQTKAKALNSSLPPILDNIKENCKEKENNSVSANNKNIALRENKEEQILLLEEQPQDSSKVEVADTVKVAMVNNKSPAVTDSIVVIRDTIVKRIVKKRKKK